VDGVSPLANGDEKSWTAQGGVQRRVSGGSAEGGRFDALPIVRSTEGPVDDCLQPTATMRTSRCEVKSRGKALSGSGRGVATARWRRSVVLGAAAANGDWTCGRETQARRDDLAWATGRCESRSCSEVGWRSCGQAGGRARSRSRRRGSRRRRQRQTLSRARGGGRRGGKGKGRDERQRERAAVVAEGRGRGRENRRGK